MDFNATIFRNRKNIIIEYNQLFWLIKKKIFSIFNEL